MSFDADSVERHRRDEETIRRIRVAAFHQGYAVGVHGSRGPKDLDLIACPWTEHARSPEYLIEHLIESQMGKGLAVSVKPEDAPEKPHGRRCWTIVRLEDHRIIDLSVMPKGCR